MNLVTVYVIADPVWSRWLLLAVIQPN